MSNIVSEKTDLHISGLVLVLFMLFCVVGCVYIVNSPERPLPLGPIVTPICKPIVTPTLPAMPAPPVLTERELHDKSLSDDALVNNIKELREWGRGVTTQYQAAVQEQLASCK
jgi:hypothetical protein